MTTDFTTRVKAVVRNIPRGEVLTYGEVAAAVGRPKAARAVARVMAGNYDPEIPCHRVVRSDHRPGGYNRGGESVKRALLVSEGVIFNETTS